MANNYVWSFEPTFTQGLVIGQLSIIFLLILVLRHLFFDSRAGRRLDTPTYHPRLEREEALQASASEKIATSSPDGGESAEWFSLILQNVIETYRSKYRDDLEGPVGDEVVRAKIEELANKLRPESLLDPIQVHAIDLGCSSPRLSNARAVKTSETSISSIELDLFYTDTVSVSISTAVLVNFPKPAFARLPVSLTISLSVFSSQIVVTPPTATAPAPTLTLTIPPTFTLELKTTSLMGSRAKLADVPKLHDLIQSQLRRFLAERGTFKVVLPGLATVAEVKEEVRKEQQDLKH